jgi:hypothetical protein
MPKDAATIENLFKGIGYSYKRGKFNAMFNRAHEWTKEDLNGQCPKGFCSVRSFMRAISVYNDVE